MTVDGENAQPVLITGGAGFIGSNLAHRLLSAGRQVVVLDNLARAGARANVAWLRERHGARWELIEGDVRDPRAVRRAVAGCGAVVHLAAQVAVTTSLTDPVTDFDVNARGTVNLLEALRALATPPPLLFTSTNKVYGALGSISVSCEEGRWAPTDPRLRQLGIDEAQPLDFHSPYGCSKGAADQYVLDFARVYGLPAVVFRMSCIYGPRQHGNADQGWVAHFARSAREHEVVTIQGDGRQVRDTLFVDDLIDAMLAAFRHLPAVRGRAFNIGGGVQNTLTLLELVALLEEQEGLRLPIAFGPWRPADQRYYVSDVRAFRGATGWVPRISVREGVRRLCQSMDGAPPRAPARADGARLASPHLTIVRAGS
ncbi:MAG TPA: SDR family NAD(P)-dependent oxidoreductase [Polyangia bacterium]